MKKVVIIGGGLAGCGAALAAKRNGILSILVERTDTLGGLGLIAGMVEHRLDCPKAEMDAMGAGAIFEVMNKCILHKNVKYPWPKGWGSTYNVHDAMKLDTELKKCMENSGVEVLMERRFISLNKTGDKIDSVVLEKHGKKEHFLMEADAFIDTTGGAGGIDFCKKYGYGCVECVMRCPTFGNRVSVAECAGVKEAQGLTSYGKIGALSSAYSLLKESVAPFVKDEIEKNGWGCFPVPKELIDYERTRSITASGNIDDGFAENLILIDNGLAKVMAAGFRPLSELHKIPGFEYARYADPLAGGVGNAVRYAAVTPFDEQLKVDGISNLFTAGEKVLCNGIVEVAILGLIAGHNASCQAYNKPEKMFKSDNSTFVGSYIKFLYDKQTKENSLKERTHMWVGEFFKNAENLGLYSQNKDEIRGRIKLLGLTNLISNDII